MSALSLLAGQTKQGENNQNVFANPACGGDRCFAQVNDRDE
jgi:hypothetical protein